MNMKNKAIGILTAVIITALSFPCFSAGNMSLLISEDFEFMQSEEKPGYPWSINIGDDASPVTVQNENGNNFARLHTNGKHYNELKYMFPKNMKNPFTVSLKIRKSSASVTTRIGFYAGEKFNNNIEFYYDSHINAINGDKTVSLMKYTTNKWYVLKIEVNPGAGKYSIYVDGECVAASFNLPYNDWHIDGNIPMDYSGGISGLLLAAYSTTGAVGVSDFDDVECLVEIPEEDFIYSDVTEKNMERCVKLLGSLGILKGYENDLFMPEDFVTRAELCTVIRRISCIPETSGKYGKSCFYDVPVDYWAANDIAFAYESGYVSGYGDGSFRPDAPVKTEEALKILLKLVNYDVFAEAKGGYPSGYNAVASERGLLKNVTLTRSELIRGNLAVILYNLLELPLMKAVSFGSDNGYRLTEKETLLTENFRIRRETGIMTDNGITGITSQTSVGEGRVKIGDTVYLISDKLDYTGLIGKNTEFFHTVDDDEPEITEIYEYKNRFFSVSGEDVTGYDGNHLFYTAEDEEEKKISINGKTPIIYNNKYIESYKQEYLTSVYGTILFTDNDSDGSWDLVTVRDFENIPVASVNNGIIYGKTNESVSTDKADTLCRIYSDGELTDITSVRPGSVISVLESDDKKIIEIHCMSREIEGIVQTVSEDEICVDGKAYKTALDITKYPVINPGESGVWTVDILGNLTFARKVNSPGQIKYGYLRAYRLHEHDAASVQLLTEDGMLEEFTVSDDLFADGKKVTSSRLSELLSGSRGYIAGYRLNDDGEIRELLFPGIDSSASIRFAEYENSGGVISPVRNKLYCGTLKAINAKTYFNAGTKFFLVPGSESYDSSLYSVADSGYFVTDEKYDYISYNTNENSMTADIVVVYRESGEKIRINDPVFLVEKRVLASSYGSVKTKLYGYLNGDYTELFVDENISSADYAERGDVLRIRVNYNNEISDVEWIIDANGNVSFDTKNQPTGFKNAAQNEPAIRFSNPDKALTEIRGRYAYGGVFERESEENLLKIFTGEPENIESHEIHRLARTTKILSVGKHNILPVTENEMIEYKASETDYSKVFIYTYYRNPVLIVVYGGE